MTEQITELLTPEQLQLITEFNSLTQLMHNAREWNIGEESFVSCYIWFKRRLENKDLTWWPVNQLEIFGTDKRGDDFVEAFHKMLEKAGEDVTTFLGTVSDHLDNITDIVDHKLDIAEIEIKLAAMENVFGRFQYEKNKYGYTIDYQENLEQAKELLELCESLYRENLETLTTLLNKHNP